MFPGEKEPVGGEDARQVIHESQSIDTIARSIKVGRLGAQAVVGSGQGFLSDLVSFRYLCSQKLTFPLSKRGLLPDKKATREDLLERVRANMRPSPRT